MLSQIENHINKYHKNDNILLCPDLARFYTFETTKLL